MYKQLVIVEFHNCCPFVYDIRSNKKISLKRLVKYFKKTEGFNEERDSIIFIAKPMKIKIK